MNEEPEDTAVEHTTDDDGPDAVTEEKPRQRSTQADYKSASAGRCVHC